MINWGYCKYFKKDEFCDNVTEYLDTLVLSNLDRMRYHLRSPIIPSPVPGSCVRFDGSKKSRHYAVGRKSDAIDVFCHAEPADVFCNILRYTNFNGIGIYLDTTLDGKTEHTMFHLDLRPDRLVWVRDDFGYNYNYSMKEIMAILGNLDI